MPICLDRCLLYTVYLVAARKNRDLASRLPLHRAVYLRPLAGLFCLLLGPRSLGPVTGPIQLIGGELAQWSYS